MDFFCTRLTTYVSALLIDIEKCLYVAATISDISNHSNIQYQLQINAIHMKDDPFWVNKFSGHKFPKLKEFSSNCCLRSCNLWNM